MTVAVDTNVLVRAVVQDDPAQGAAAAAILTSGETIAVSPIVLCEMVWVLRSRYRLNTEQQISAVRSLIDADEVVTDAPCVAAGLTQLEAGGDFADGVASYQGRWLGATEFVSFDQKAVELQTAQGHKARLL